MPRRWGQNVQLWVYRYLVARDGEQCARCFTIPGAGVKNEGTVPLEIDHIDGDPWNNEPTNLRLLCKPCNITLRNHPHADSPKNVCGGESERPRAAEERGEGQPATRVVRQDVDYRHAEAPPTMQANFLFEIDFRSWLLKQVQERAFVPRQDAIDAGAELVGCSPKTTERYVRKLVSSCGPLQEVRDMLGSTMLTWKAGLKPPKPEPVTLIDLDKGERIK